MKRLIINEIQNSINVKNEILNNNEIITQIENLVNNCIISLKSGGKIIFCGNGGSAADASHAVAEFVGRYIKKKREPLNAISLNENNSTITALANDFEYKYVFSKQLEAVGKKGDILFAISTSGKSKNIIEVIKKAKLMKLKTILLTGDNKISKKICDICIKVPAKRVDRIQELHILILHLLAEYVDQRN